MLHNFRVQSQQATVSNGRMTSLDSRLFYICLSYLNSSFIKTVKITGELFLRYFAYSVLMLQTV